MGRGLVLAVLVAVAGGVPMFAPKPHSETSRKVLNSVLLEHTDSNATKSAASAIRDRCESARQNTKLFNDAGCSALFDRVKAGGSECDSPCWFDMIVELGQLTQLDCLADVDALDVALRCQSLEQACASSSAFQCGSTWVQAGCPEQPPARCSVFQKCFDARKPECNGEFKSSEYSAVITLIVSVPLSISPSQFRATFAEAFIVATSISAGVHPAQISINSVSKGLIISIDIAVSEAQAVEVFHRLDASLSSNTFRDNVNSKLPSTTQVAKLSNLALTSSVSLTSVPPPNFPDLNPETAPPVILDPSVTPLNLPLSLCPKNCSHHGKCVGLLQDGPGSCVCDKGYGRSSASETNDCSEFTLPLCPDLCFGHGLCVPHADSQNMTCQCFDGYFGPVCNKWNRCKDRKFCSGHGSCTRSSPLEFALPEACVCDHGFTGQRCETKLLGCEDNCGGHGVCISFANNSRKCECEPGFFGPTCVEVKTSCPNACSALGNCDSTSNQCSCVDGASGPDCSTLTRSCGPCAHGTCDNGVCKCLPGFSGTSCNVFNRTSSDTDCKRLNFCSGNGVCGHNGEAQACTCFVGAKGPDCSIVDVDEPSLCPNHCSGHGKCTLGSWAYSCTCDHGWTGPDCAVSACPTNRGRVCSGHGICEAPNGGDAFKCTCDSGYISDALSACEHSLCPNECNGHGRCNDDGSCTCAGGFTGLDCSVSPSKAHLVMAETSNTNTASSASEPQLSASSEVREDEEQGPVLDLSSCVNSCSRHGQCLMGKCQCKKGYTGDDCSSELPSLFEEDNLDNLDLLELRSEERESIGKLWD